LIQKDIYATYNRRAVQFLTGFCDHFAGNH